MVKVKSIKIVAGGTQITVENSKGETLVGKTYFDFDGKDKVEFEGKVYEYEGAFTLKER